MQQRGTPVRSSSDGRMLLPPPRRRGGDLSPTMMRRVLGQTAEGIEEINLYRDWSIDTLTRWTPLQLRIFIAFPFVLSIAANRLFMLFCHDTIVCVSALHVRIVCIVCIVWKVMYC